MVNHRELTAAQALLREKLQNASKISSAERDLLSSLITDMTRGTTVIISRRIRQTIAFVSYCRPRRPVMMPIIQNWPI